MKRDPLEEAVINKKRHASGEKSAPKDEEALSVLKFVRKTPPLMDNSAAYIDRHENEFCLLYCPSDFTPGANPPGAYVASVISGMTSSQRGMALDFAARALWMSRLGKIRNEQSLIVQAGLAYGTALRYLQEALYDEQLASKDKTFAAASILSIYEVQVPQR